MITRFLNKNAFVLVLVTILILILIAPMIVFPLAQDAVGTIASQRAQAFKQITPLSNQEKTTLRLFRNAAHVAAAESLGVSGIQDRPAVDSLVEKGELVPLEDNDYFVVQRMEHSVPYVTPAARDLLVLIGKHFHETLREQNLPLYRYVISSGLRTRKDQANLTRVNVNAAKSFSSHEFGTTVDLLYTKFQAGPVAEVVPWYLRPFETFIEERLETRYKALGRRHQEELKALLGRTLIELQADNKVLVIYERLQPVYHITIAQKISPEDTLAVEEEASVDPDAPAATP